jgi:hypothetical protein
VRRALSIAVFAFAACTPEHVVLIPPADGGSIGSEDAFVPFDDASLLDVGSSMDAQQISDVSPVDVGVRTDCTGAQDGTPCGAMFDCEGIIQGLTMTDDHVRCIAASGMIAGICSSEVCFQASASDCVRAPSGQRIECDVECALATPSCVRGEPISGIDRSSLCTTNGPGADCSGMGCVDAADLESYGMKTCNQDGRCRLAAGTEMSCGLYACRDSSGCLTSCSDGDDCAESATCSAPNCVP